MAQGKRISTDIAPAALQAIQQLGAAAKAARLRAGEGQSAAAAQLGVHVQTIGRIEAGEPGVAIGHVMGLLALYGLDVRIDAQATAQAAAPSATSAGAAPATGSSALSAHKP